MEKLKKASITVDNQLSPSHTMLRIECSDQKGLFYDMTRISKDCDIRVFALFSASFFTTTYEYELPFFWYLYSFDYC